MILPNAVEDVLAKCKGECTTANEKIPNAGFLAMCNKVCHLVISVLLFIHTDYHAHLVKKYLQVCDDAYNAAKKNGVEGVAVTSSTLLISLAVGLLMK